MSIVICMQNFINIYQKVQEIGPVSLFSEFEPRQNLDRSQMSFDNLIGYINVYAKFHHNILHSSRDRAIFTFSEFGARQSLDRQKNLSSQSLGLDLVNINVYAIVYQSIPFSSRDRAIFTFSEFGTRQSLDR